MNNLEKRLRDAMRRQAAPPGLVEKVMARAAAFPQPVASRWRRFSRYFSLPALRLAGAVAVAGFLIAVAGLVHQQRQERLRREGEMAKAQVTEALRVASTKLNVARSKVEDPSKENSFRRL
jgi:hypothetical protein